MLMRHVGASYERCGKAKMQGLRFEKLTDQGSFFRFPKSITHLNWKPEKGRDYHQQETPLARFSYSARRMRANVRRRPALSSYRPRYLPEGKEMVNVGRSLAADRRPNAKAKSQRRHPARGDTKRTGRRRQSRRAKADWCLVNLGFAVSE